MPSSSNTLSSKSGSERTPSFICEIPLRVAPAEARILNARLEAARQVYNACLGEAARAGDLMLETFHRARGEWAAYRQRGRSPA